MGRGLNKRPIRLLNPFSIRVIKSTFWCNAKLMRINEETEWQGKDTVNCFWWQGAYQEKERKKFSSLTKRGCVCECGMQPIHDMGIMRYTDDLRFSFSDSLWLQQKKARCLVREDWPRSLMLPRAKGSVSKQKQYLQLKVHNSTVK